MTRLQKTLFQLVFADFKSVKNKFIRQGIEVETVKEYLEEFKKIKTKYKNLGESGNVDYWGKKPWEEFKSFVDEKKSSVSKTQEKKLEKLDGAELIAENKKWFIYKILTHKAARIYGSGTKWCITQESPEHWSNYIRENEFYFFISKTRNSDDPWYKIAMTFNAGGDSGYWDATDKPTKMLPKEIYDTLPDFQPVFDEDSERRPSIKAAIEELKRTGELTEAIKTTLYDELGEEIHSYDKDNQFLIFEKFKNLNDFADTLTSRYRSRNRPHSYEWNLSILSGDHFMDFDSNISDIEGDLEEIICMVQANYERAYNDFIKELIKDETFVEFAKNEDASEDTDREFSIEKYTKIEDFNLVVAKYIASKEGAVSNVFERAYEDAIRSVTESKLYNTIKKEIEGCNYLLLKGHFLDDELYLGIPLDHVPNFSEADMRHELNTLGVEEYNYEIPDNKEIVEHLVEYHMPEYQG